MPDNSTVDAYKILHDNFPWPDVTGFHAHNFTLGGGGRELVERELDHIQNNKKIMLEIGCFMCASTKRWLEHDPDLLIVGVDPWNEDLKEQVKRYVDRPLLNRLYPDPHDQQRFVNDVNNQGPLETALANVIKYKERFIPVKGYSPDALEAIKHAGIEPDIVYIDGAKQIEDLEECHRLWPETKITGDDWHWGRTHGYPMRKIVKKFAKAHGFGIEANWATWVLSRDIPMGTIVEPPREKTD